VEKHALFLKTLHDAQRLRHRILDNIEVASIPGQTEEEKKRLLTFLIVGAGPTGTELAAELHDMLETDGKKWFPDLHKHFKIVLVHSADHILSTFDKKISLYAEEKFRRDDIQVLTDTRVKSISDRSVVLFDKKANTETPFPYVVS
jgi:NADH dehydrogenase FAD-containing subunit